MTKDISAKSDTRDSNNVQGQDGGRLQGGESGGGPYKDPDQVRGDPDAGGFMGHGGQSNIAYHGSDDPDGGDDNPNAVTKGD